MEPRSQEIVRGFHMLAKPIGPICNMACRYCFYLEKEKLFQRKPAHADWAMPEDLLERFIRQYIAAQPGQVVNFAWQGGEPTLLGVDFFRKVVSLQQKHAHGKRIENALQTNGILLDDRWCDFLARNRFLIGLSLDGPRELHDRYRVDKGGAPSFDRVLRGISYVKKHGVEFNTLTVAHRDNSCRPLEVYRFLKEVGSGFMQFIPIVERVAHGAASDDLALVSPDSTGSAHVAPFSVEPLQYGKFLRAIFDDWVRNDVGKTYVQLFDLALAAWTGMEPDLCVFQQTCGSAAVIEHNGDVYACDHYVYPENRLGNLMALPLAEMMSSAQQSRFGRDKLERLPQCCRECSVRFVCNGECPKHRFVRTPDGEERLNYLCPGYKLFFTHIDPYMKFMAAELAEERPPANVMAWAQARDRGAAGNKGPGRNDPCPCGSGLKFKRCCGRIGAPASRSVSRSC
jgi:uncharacterized protein